MKNQRPYGDVFLIKSLTALFVSNEESNKLTLIIPRGVKYLTAYLTAQAYNSNMVVCGNCHHKRSFHKKVDGNAWCSVNLCACKQFVEQEVPFNRRAIHEALDKFLDDFLSYEPDKEL